MKKRIVVCGNSTAFGLEMEKEAQSIAELRQIFKETKQPHENSWPSQLKGEISVLNLSKPTSGFFQNVERAVEYSRGNPEKDSLFLIDVSLLGHFTMDIDFIQRNPVFFSRDSIFFKAYSDMTGSVATSIIWQTTEILRKLNIQFLLFASLHPFRFLDLTKLNQSNDLDENYQIYADFLYQIEKENLKIDFPEFLIRYLVYDRPLISSIGANLFTRYIHPKGVEGHKKIAINVMNGLSKNQIFRNFCEK